MSPLYHYINLMVSMEHRYSVTDCVTICGGWIDMQHGVDPFEDVRYTYGSLLEAERKYRWLTDPLSHFAPRMENNGFKRGNQLKVGDVGLIQRLDDPRTVLAALRIDSAWASLAESGAASLHENLCRPVAFWSMNYEG